MGYVVLAAEIAAVLWFLAFFALIAMQRRASAGAVAPRLDPIGPSLLRNAKGAFVVGLGALFSYSLVAVLDWVIGLGLGLPL